jgi:hypothetical protein
MNKYMIGLLVAGSLSSSLAMADDKSVTVEITNLSNALYYTPLLVSAHNRNTHLFQTGSAASAHLQAMAEGGNISGLIADLDAAGASSVANPAAGLLAPGASTTATVSMSKGNRYLSIAAMLLPTNDGFVGLDALKIPNKKGSHVFYLNGYDAGTEANDEVVNGGGAPGTPGIPADPGGNAGSGAAGVTGADHNATVHVHRGIVGGDYSDLDSAVHRWMNPVAKVVVTVGNDDD